ncbi:MAG: hypothetical protein JW731_00925 [Bacteroidales bacterium]|nr:hypothetical protein [Bacteroidales bacterium]
MKLKISRIIPVGLLTILIVTVSCNRKSEYSTETGYEVITDNGEGTGTTTWTPGKKYLLDGFVFVNDGQILTIEAGTVIRASTGQGENASALIVSRGGKIIAEGNSVSPIVFTCEGDDLEGSVPVFAKGLWGGLIILGNAPLNNENNEAYIEGIPVAEPRGIFGGWDENDNSGILKYVSIRHGGTNIGSENEINGLTLGGVGNNTLIEYVEVISNYDDGIELFGGSVNCKYIVSAFNGDDAFDYDLGYHGKGQFWLAIQDPAEGDLIIEGSGGQDPELGQPYSLPIIYNGTFIGRGNNITNRTIRLDRFAGGIFGNSIFTNQHSGIYIQYIENYNNCFDQFQNSNIRILNNIFWDIAENLAYDIFNVYAQNGENIENQNEQFKQYFVDAENTVSNPEVEITSETYRILPQGNISDNLAPEPDSWFTNVDYKGAFLYDNWARNWSLIHQSGWIE